MGVSTSVAFDKKLTYNFFIKMNIDGHINRLSVKRKKNWGHGPRFPGITQNVRRNDGILPLFLLKLHYIQHTIVRTEQHLDNVHCVDITTTSLNRPWSTIELHKASQYITRCLLFEDILHAFVKDLS